MSVYKLPHPLARVLVRIHYGHRTAQSVVLAAHAYVKTIRRVLETRYRSRG
jgi:hypothetical protein